MPVAKKKAIIISQGKIKGQFPLFSDQEFPFPPEKAGEKHEDNNKDEKADDRLLHILIID